MVFRASDMSVRHVITLFRQIFGQVCPTEIAK